MKRLSTVALVLVAAAAMTASAARPKWTELDGYTFERYVGDFNRPYVKGTEEYEMRKRTFLRRLRIAQHHNKNPAATWRRGVNMFSDMTDAEWKAYNRGGKKVSAKSKPVRVHKAQAAGTPAPPLPILVDYRTWTSPRVLTDVKHQGSCGNCWAHSAAETIESHFALATGRLPVLSTQQITSCVASCDGCGGGNAFAAYDYINSTYHGLTEEWAYPFSDFFFNYREANSTTAKCYNLTDTFPNKHRPYSWFAELTRAGVSGYVNINPNDAVSAQSGLATAGPLSISVAAGNWQDYETGILQNSAANGAQNEWGVDHDVQMVGYGHDAGFNMDYWIVRNSWSTNWGEQGFIRLFRAANPADEPCSPASMGPVCGTSGCLNGPRYPLVFAHPGQKW